MSECLPVGALVRNKGGSHKAVFSNVPGSMGQRVPTPTGQFALVAAVEPHDAYNHTENLVRLRMLPGGEECLFHPDYFTPNKNNGSWFWEIVETPDAAA